MGTRKLWCLLSALIGAGAAYLAYVRAPELVAWTVPLPEASAGAGTLGAALAAALSAFGLLAGGLALLGLGVADIRAVGAAVERLRRLEGAERRAGAEILHSLGLEPALHGTAAVVGTWLRAEQGVGERERRPLGPLTSALVTEGLRYRRLVPYGAALLVLAGIGLAALAAFSSLPGFATAGDEPATLASVAVRLSGAALAVILPVFAAALVLVCHLALGESLAGAAHQLMRALAHLLPLADTDLTLRQLEQSFHTQIETLIRAVEGGYADIGRQIEASAGSGSGSGSGTADPSVARDLTEIRSLLLGLGSDLRANSGRIGEALGPLASVTRELRDAVGRLQDLTQRLADLPAIAAEPARMHDGADPADFAQAIEELVVENEQAVRRLPRI